MRSDNIGRIPNSFLTTRSNVIGFSSYKIHIKWAINNELVLNCLGIIKCANGQLVCTVTVVLNYAITLRFRRVEI